MPLPAADRRTVLAAAGIGAVMPLLAACGASPAAAKSFRITKTEAEWRRILTPDQYHILREAGTERAFSHPLNKEKRKGTFICAGCGNALYASAHKYDSGTGWPSFWRAIDWGAVGTSTDYKIGYPRTEVHCADCGGHLGHIFGDGPQPTGQRHCINGLALRFVPA
ncbi:peptide-methionine (R)-S-oxide reductase MsrB [Erythrobacter tepidarius]|uniref:peptide-methionine (R)-S-oxide reductase MsrB n=1 Tax=Erythrobacter tepidarius TaxID=60454 RepID=UPI000A36085E|nr:peptide-methionine (R)-S-oxide reductase MsrB [Erythrobacter tepidarius]